MKKIISDDLVLILKEYAEYVEKQGGKYVYIDKLGPLLEDLIDAVKIHFTKEYLTFGLEKAMVLSGAEQIIGKSIRDAMKANIFYKDIYRNTKKTIELFAEMNGQSKVLSQCLLEGEEVVWKRMLNIRKGKNYDWLGETRGRNTRYIERNKNMNFKILGEENQPAVFLYLSRRSDGDIDVKASGVGVGIGIPADILRITKKGKVEFPKNIPDEYGFCTDSSGRIEIHNR